MIFPSLPFNFFTQRFKVDIDDTGQKGTSSQTLVICILDALHALNNLKHNNLQGEGFIEKIVYSNSYIRLHLPLASGPRLQALPWKNMNIDGIATYGTELSAAVYMR